MELLSAELREQLGDRDDLVLSGKKTKRKPSASKQLAEVMTSTKKRKLALIAEKRAKAARRKELLDSIAKESLSEEQRSLLASSSLLGQEETLKQKLSRTLKEKRANLQTDDSILFVRKQSCRTFDESKDADAQHGCEQSESIVGLIEKQDSPQIQKVCFPTSGANVVQVSDRKKKKKSVILCSTLDSESVNMDVGEKVRDPSLSQALVAAEDSRDQAKTEDSLSVDIRSFLPVRPLEEEKPTLRESESASCFKTFSVVPKRSSRIQEERQALPIYGDEQEIIEAINHHDFVIICGPTGSGKTTQVPQFLYENGYSFSESGRPGLIGITQPRRIAAISTYRRVVEELGPDYKDHVGYQVRYDSHVNGDTCHIKFMTDGILLREVKNDFLLKKYSVILIDEAHERNLNTDILIGLLSRIAPLRNKLSLSDSNVSPLRVVIMSATLRVDGFVKNSKLFPDPLLRPPVIEIASRQFPVSIHFNRVTPDDYVREVVKKTCKIHRKLPPGGILVFLTGRQEIEYVCRELHKILVSKESEVPEDFEDPNDPEDDPLKEGDIAAEENETGSEVENVRILPLYSVLDPKRQALVFEKIPNPENLRLIVVASNVAETSITIPGIKYVVDSGKEKSKVYDKISGMSKFVIDWTSQASAEQRAGRAGRTGPGHCYRLYSSAVYNNYFDKFSAPEVLTSPVDSLLLQMKSMEILDVENFPFPSTPDPDAVKSAVLLLENLGAVDMETSNRPLNKLGRMMSHFPVAPRFAKMLLLGKCFDCLDYVVAIISALTVGNLIKFEDEVIPSESHDDNEDQDAGLNEQDIRKKKLLKSYRAAQRFWDHPDCDLISLLRIVCAFDYAEDQEQFCNKYFLRIKSLREITKLRIQLTRLAKHIDVSLDCEDKDTDDVDADKDQDKETAFIDLKQSPPSAAQEKLIIQIIASAFVDQVAQKWPEAQFLEAFPEMTALQAKSAYRVFSRSEPVFIHPRSCLFQKDRQPDLMVFTELNSGRKLYVNGITRVDLECLAAAVQGSPLCRLSKPLESPAPFFSKGTDEIMCFVQCHFGPWNWELAARKVPFPDNSEKPKVFARLLLEGQVFPELEPLRPFWSSRPSSFLSVPLHLQSKVTRNLLFQFSKTRCDSIASLKTQLNSNPKFMHRELLALLRPSLHARFNSLWEQVTKSLSDLNLVN
jgi:ATP-dependent RNA helicase DHX37/DHR1